MDALKEQSEPRTERSPSNLADGWVAQHAVRGTTIGPCHRALVSVERTKVPSLGSFGAADFRSGTDPCGTALASNESGPPAGRTSHVRVARVVRRRYFRMAGHDPKQVIVLTNCDATSTKSPSLMPSPRATVEILRKYDPSYCVILTKAPLRDARTIRRAPLRVAPFDRWKSGRPVGANGVCHERIDVGQQQVRGANLSALASRCRTLNLSRVFTSELLSLAEHQS